MNNTLTLLLNVINKEDSDSINYKIADYLLHHLGQLHHMSTSFLARECHVSKSAISRFCRYIGLEDFLDLQIMARTPLLSIEDQFLSYNKETLVSDYLTSVHHQIQSLTGIQLDSLIADIDLYEHVYVMGHMQSSLPAYNLQYDLAQLGKYIRCIDDVVTQKQILLNASSNDLIIIFSSSGNFIQHTFIRELEMKSCQARIYMITLTDIQKKSSYIYKYISYPKLAHTHTSVMAMIAITNIIVLKYYQRYLTVS